MINGLPSEHILLESEAAEPAFAVGSVGAVRARLVLTNRLRGVRTELKLYEDDYLGVRVQRAGYQEPEQRFALGHLDPRPALSCRVAETARSAALCCIVLASLMAGFAYLSMESAITLPAAAAAFVGATASAALFVYRTEEQVQFLTRHGRVAVVTLTASFGCIRACRELVPQLVAAIRESASSDGGDRKSHLRAEVREHYRLREGGALSQAECSSAVQRILRRFD